MAKGRNNVTILKVARASKHGFADERRLWGETLFYLRYQRLANASYPPFFVCCLFEDWNAIAISSGNYPFPPCFPAIIRPSGKERRR